MACKAILPKTLDNAAKLKQATGASLVEAALLVFFLSIAVLPALSSVGKRAPVPFAKAGLSLFGAPQEASFEAFMPPGLEKGRPTTDSLLSQLDSDMTGFHAGGGTDSTTEQGGSMGIDGPVSGR
ncbi:MAG: hypothetical protein KDD64_04205 [Bdellovibrionales bacterium]|nr:hypothetical protein [Bdellovibrionales bacterium]